MSIADVFRIRKTAEAGEQVSREDVLLLCAHVMEAVQRGDKAIDERDAYKVLNAKWSKEIVRLTDLLAEEVKRGDKA